MHVFICENTPNGILTGVYDAWELKIQERCSHADIYLVSSQPDNYELFCDYHTVAPSAEKAGIGLTLDLPAAERVEGTIVTTVMAVEAGCMFVRVHDVKENHRAIQMTEAILYGKR